MAKGGTTHLHCPGKKESATDLEAGRGKGMNSSLRDSGSLRGKTLHFFLLRGKKGGSATFSRKGGKEEKGKVSRDRR